MPISPSRFIEPQVTALKDVAKAEAIGEQPRQKPRQRRQADRGMAVEIQTLSK